LGAASRTADLLDALLVDQGAAEDTHRSAA
jgi:hypothetical protein